MEVGDAMAFEPPAPVSPIDEQRDAAYIIAYNKYLTERADTDWNEAEQQYYSVLQQYYTAPPPPAIGGFGAPLGSPFQSQPPALPLLPLQCSPSRGNAFAAMVRPLGGKRAGPGEPPHQNAKRQRGLADGDANTMEAE